MKVKAITSFDSRLIIHEFSTQKQAFETLPFIRKWDIWIKSDGEIRYHSKQAIKYWNDRKVNDPIHGTRIKHLESGETEYEYY